MKHVNIYIASLIMLVSLAACSSSDERDENAPVPPVEILYNQGKDELDSKQYKKAIETFEILEREYPFSEWTQRAKLHSAYAAYERGEYVDAIGMLQSYIKLYPASKDTPYAYYLIALSYYEQITDIKRDQDNTEKARQAFYDVVRRFPNSPYAKDAKFKLDLVNDHLAGKEMEVGRYYQKRGLYVPAISRFNYVVDNYQTTTHVQEALHRLVECYMVLGLKDDAKRAAAVLGHNYPHSDWYRDSYRLLTGDSSATPVRPEDTDWWDGVKDSVKDIF